jgi:hypothetical protein
VAAYISADSEEHVYLHFGECWLGDVKIKKILLRCSACFGNAGASGTMHRYGGGRKERLLSKGSNQYVVWQIEDHIGLRKTSLLLISESRVIVMICFR